MIIDLKAIGGISTRVADDGPRVPPFVVAACLMAGVTLLAITCIDMTPATDRVASIWVGNAVAVAVLMRRPRTEHQLLLLALFLGSAAADLIMRDTLAQSLVFALCNLVEVGLVIAWMERIHPAHQGLDSQAISHFILVALIAPIGSAIGAALWLDGPNASFAALVVT